jgi:cellulose synthase/poly-beta-1,6-N-acetylglucosamine synthase-like glycosyltransferase
MSLLAAPLAVAAGALVLMAGYLDALSLAALRRRPPPPPAGARTAFAILVPAHDEAGTIERLLASIARLDYPRERVDVVVVADACGDATAAIARDRGAHVYERRDPARPGKGPALSWALERLAVEFRRYDAYVVVDADSTLSPNFLRAMDARLAAGSSVVQAHYVVSNPDASPVAALRTAALASLHYTRPLGRAALGLSCGLKGNGMCFARSVIERFGWPSSGLAEDVEFHLALVRAGVRVDFAPETTVAAEMPATFAQATSQQRRWERGRLDVALRLVPALLRDGIARRDPRMTDAALEQLVPPLSVPLAAAAACTVVAVASGDALAAVLSAIAVGGLAAHVVGGMIAAHAPRSAYAALAFAPFYVVWKLALYARVAVDPRSARWQRTARADRRLSERG